MDPRSDHRNPEGFSMTTIAGVAQGCADAGLTRSRFEDIGTVLDAKRVRSRTFRDSATAEAVHDFRNILGTVSMLSELALMDLPETSPVSATVRSIRAACADAKDLCNRMLDDACNASRSIELVNLSDLVTALEPLLATYVPADSELLFFLMDGTPLAEGSPGGIRQVVMNLVKNAAEALGGRPGSVMVSTGLIEFDTTEDAECPGQGSIGPGLYSYLAVTDTGCGMDEATRARLFEGSFTTKADGHGLGMASIRRTVHGCGGFMQVASQVGSGTQIRVLFPQSGNAAGVREIYVSDRRSSKTDAASERSRTNPVGEGLRDEPAGFLIRAGVTRRATLVSSSV
jgi:signal transduction histidine kinase